MPKSASRFLRPLHFLVERSRYAAEKQKIAYTPLCAQFRAPYRKEYTMKPAEAKRFNELYQRHLYLFTFTFNLHLQGFTRGVPRQSINLTMFFLISGPKYTLKSTFLQVKRWF